MSGHRSACVTRLPCTPSVHAPNLVSPFSLHCLYFYSLSFPSVPSPCATCAPFIDTTHHAQQRTASTPLFWPHCTCLSWVPQLCKFFFLLLFYLAHSRLRACCPLPSCCVPISTPPRCLAAALTPQPLGPARGPTERLGCREREWRIMGTRADARGEAVA